MLVLPAVQHAHLKRAHACACAQVPAKQRLVVLAALLCQTCQQRRGRAKAVVFMSSCDGVEFAHTLLGEAVEVMEGAPLLPCPLLKLHGNLPQVGQHPLPHFRCLAFVHVLYGAPIPSVTQSAERDIMAATCDKHMQAAASSAAGVPKVAGCTCSGACM